MIDKMFSSVLEEDEKAILKKYGLIVQNMLGSKYQFSSTYLLKACGVYGTNFTRGKKYTCKVMDESRIPLTTFKKFHSRELKMLACLGDHPYIIEVVSIMKLGRKHLVMTKYYDRGTLLEYIENRGPLSEERSRKWLRQIILAVIYLHQLNIVHRNIKAENILITNRKNIRLSGFNFSRLAVDNGRDILCCTFCGTLSYAAPELLIAKKYNARLVDVWSVGVILYLMLNGKFPYDMSNISSAIKKMRENSYQHQISTLTKNAKDLINRLLAFKPSSRIHLEEIVVSHFYGFQWKWMLMRKNEKKAYTLARWINEEYRKRAYEEITLKEYPNICIPPYPPDGFQVPQGYPDYDELLSSNDDLDQYINMEYSSEDAAESDINSKKPTGE